VSGSYLVIFLTFSIKALSARTSPKIIGVFGNADAILSRKMASEIPEYVKKADKSNFYF